MASLSDFGLAPEEPQSRRPRRERYLSHDESGARPLPRDEYRDEFDDELYVDPLDEEVELPGVSRPRAGLLFGIGVGLGIALLAVAGSLYLGGYVGRPALGPAPEATAMTERPTPLDEMMNDRALALARIAPVWISEEAARPGGTELESPDITVVDEAKNAAPMSVEPAGGTRNRAPGAASEMSGEELEGAEPASGTTDSSRLSNELDQLQQSLRPRGPVPPQKAPTNDQSAPAEPNLPPPAEPTAPAETIPPANQSP